MLNNNYSNSLAQLSLVFLWKCIFFSLFFSFSLQKIDGNNMNKCYLKMFSGNFFYIAYRL